MSYSNYIWTNKWGDASKYLNNKSNSNLLTDVPQLKSTQVTITKKKGEEERVSHIADITACYHVTFNLNEQRLFYFRL